MIQKSCNLFKQLESDKVHHKLMLIHAEQSKTEVKLRLLHGMENCTEKVIECRREHMWEDTLPHLDDSFSHYSIKIKIRGEIGSDYGGLAR